MRDQFGTFGGTVYDFGDHVAFRIPGHDARLEGAVVDITDGKISILNPRFTALGKSVLHEFAEGEIAVLYRIVRPASAAVRAATDGRFARGQRVRLVLDDTEMECVILAAHDGFVAADDGSRDFVVHPIDRFAPFTTVAS